jgi:hypothetical protein
MHVLYISKTLYIYNTKINAKNMFNSKMIMFVGWLCYPLCIINHNNSIIVNKSDILAELI